MPSTAVDNLPLVRVAAGLIRDASGALLVQRRPEHQPYAGFWEFPGGKIEAGETPAATLARELAEELDVEVRAAAPFLTYRHRYAEKRVELHVWRVDAFAGPQPPRAMEGQHLAWCPPGKLAGLNLLRGNQTILRALELPVLYAITAAHRYGVDAQLHLLDEALAAGLRLVQVREPGLAAAELTRFLAGARQRCAAHGARLLLSARHSGVADGVHLPSDELAQRLRRPTTPVAAASCHDEAELQRAATLDLDFAVLSPVVAGGSHARQNTPLGWRAFADLVRTASLPVYALGGMAAGDLENARGSGARGLAMISGLWEAGPARVLEALSAAEARALEF
ncbi:MAG: Nudix family hydrolase [Gammaproteobacteria bacterium]|nr:Nudix family hydrolase [Gammaproteobacteria bacterium]